MHTDHHHGGRAALARRLILTCACLLAPAGAWAARSASTYGAGIVHTF